MKICSFNEYDPLESVIVGTATHASFPNFDQLFRLNMSQGSWTETPPPGGRVDDRIIDETNEDLEDLANTLRLHGVEVYRPKPLRFDLAGGQYAYCPRDNLLVVGDTVIEAPMSVASRQMEMLCYEDIRNEAIAEGANWIAAPHPLLRYEDNVTDGRFALAEKEPVFDAANVCRFGRNLLYLVSNSANVLGAQWLQKALGPYYSVITTDVYDAAHIDSTIVSIDEDYVVLNASRVTESSLPWFLKDLEKIWITEDMIVPQAFYKYPYASKWIAINMLALGNKKVICDLDQPRIMDELSKHGFEPIPQQLRHSRTLGGGFHCVTVDLARGI